ncbi:tail fiber assembly protein [Xenorhabdus japonica]|uniref:Virus tail fibre assembly protein, lambda gpK n=1 Tax=Xenorhabdus japonica TaxID=53341 RepID=A0A1I5B666_9GAMM|nr:tail fiber assembly protein [Xenorhabdus japonica]SFN70197.1 virus tail fibre assembly protein, lambda gpK [Xenorhabdus japonica]
MKYATNIKTAEFNENGFALSNGWVTVYRANTETGEYLCADMERTVLGFSLSAGAYLDEPTLPESDNVAVCRSPDGLSWGHVPDYRGKTVYHIKNRESRVIQQLGSLPPELTLLRPNTDFDVWNGKKWVTDFAAQKAKRIELAERQRAQLRQQAEENIRLLQYAIETELATESEKRVLIEWKKYLVALSRLDISGTTDITWPEQPNVAA